MLWRSDRVGSFRGGLAVASSVASAVALAACSFAGNTASGSDGDADASMSADGSEGETLIVDGLLARYFIDELASGTGLTLSDAAADPFDLTLEHLPSPATSAMSYCERDGGHRGLCWAALGDSSKATAPIAGSKIEVGLGGATRATVELVVTIDESLLDCSRIFQIGEGSVFQDGLAVMSHTSGELAVTFGSLAKIVTNDPLPAGRLVVHAVIDSNRPQPADRMLVYVNGAPVTIRDTNCGPGTTCGLPAQGATLNVANHFLSLGNRRLGERSFDGVLHHVALYDRALAPTEIAAQTDALGNRDDR